MIVTVFLKMCCCFTARLAVRLLSEYKNVSKSVELFCARLRQKSCPAKTQQTKPRCPLPNQWLLRAPTNTDPESVQAAVIGHPIPSYMVKIPNTDLSSGLALTPAQTEQGLASSGSHTPLLYQMGI